MEIGGTQQVVRRLLLALDGKRYNAQVVCIVQSEPGRPANRGALGDKLDSEGIPVDILERKPGFDFNLVAALRRLMKRHETTLVHCHQHTPWVYGTLAAIGKDIRVVFTEHGRFYPDSASWKRRLANRPLAWFTDRITAISRATANALSSVEGLPAKRIQVIYNGTTFDQQPTVPPCDLVAWREQFDEPDCLTFGTIARFDPIKNLPMLLRAFAELLGTHPGSRLLLVGDGEERETLIKLCGEFGISDSVCFTGFRTDTAECMAAIDVFVLSSFSEGTSMTLLEALAGGKCCIVTRVGGNTEIIEDELNGLIVASDDVPGLYQAMTRITKDKMLRENLQRNARNILNSSFTVEAMTKEYEILYSTLGVE